MSDVIVHRVKPTLPTALGDREYLPYVDPLLMELVMCSTWVLPGPISLEKLKHALSKTLHDYPHAAGRFSYDDLKQKWQIRLTNDDVPIVLGTTELVLDDDLMHQDPHPEIIDSMSTPTTPVNLFDQPLLKLKLVTWSKTGETSLSFVWNHAIGDSTALHRFWAALSDYYLDVQPSITPTFEAYLQQPPMLERDLNDDTLKLIPEYGVTYDKGVMHNKFLAMIDSTSRIDVKFSSRQLAAMRAAADGGASSGTRISTQDSLTAYLVNVLNQILPTPVEYISCVMNVRGIERAAGSEYVPPPFTSAGHVVINISSETIPAHTSIGGIATILRKAVQRAREPECTRRILALIAECHATNVANNRLHHWLPLENSVVVNNFSRWPEGTTHFGYPGRVRFYWYGNANEKYFRIWPANPVKLPDGTWKTYEGGVDVTFRLKHELRPAFLRIVEEDLRTMLFD